MTEAAEETERPEPVGFRSGFVAIVGRPNVGKSTLVNALAGTKVAIVSDKPQTTRHRLRAVIDRPEAQVVLVDTPGLHKPADALGEEVNRSALLALADVDVVCLLIDATMPVGRGDEWVAGRVRASQAAKVLVLTKADLADEPTVMRQLDAARALADFDEEVVVSAVADFNLDGFLAAVVPLLPEGPRYFPTGMATDQPTDVMLAELVREKVLHHTRDEVPHSVGVRIEETSYDEKKDLATVRAEIYVERASQKGIIVGKGGDMIRRIGTEARKDMERLLGSKVYLDLAVKEKKDWRSDATQIRRFGYGEGL